MMTIISTVISFLIGGVPKLLDRWQDSADKKHELELARMQTERELQMLEKGYAAQAKVEEIRTDQISIQADANVHMALLQHDIESAKGASQWVINARAMVRPAITYGMFLLLAFVDIFGFWFAFHREVDFEIALKMKVLVERSLRAEQYKI